MQISQILTCHTIPSSKTPFISALSNLLLPYLGSVGLSQTSCGEYDLVRFVSVGACLRSQPNPSITGPKSPEIVR